MCNQEATSVEHAPPKCLFPATKDVPNQRDYRKNLITVPSCDDHNSATSRDDEHLLYTLSASITCNDVGLNQFLTKVKRALERSPTFASTILVGSEPVEVFDEDTQECQEAFCMHVQGNRLDAVFKKCAYALYFHETNTKFQGSVTVVTGFTLYNVPSLNSAIASAIISAEDYFSQHVARGNNPDVFFYKFEEGEYTGIMLMYFYGKSKVLVRFDKR